jgi:hypothetical protein
MYLGYFEVDHHGSNELQKVSRPGGHFWNQNFATEMISELVGHSVYFLATESVRDIHCFDKGGESGD